MHDFHYVAKKEASPVKNELYEILHQVQDLVREYFTFSFTPIGSSSRDMITYDTKSNIGYDFDINIMVNDDAENFTPKEIRCLIRYAINRFAPLYGYKCCEDSKRVLTIKKIDYPYYRIKHSCDFAIVRKRARGIYEYIRFNKPTIWHDEYYSWERQSKSFAYLNDKINWLKKNKLWGDLRDYYIEKKNYNTNPNKHSRSIFAEAINDLCHKNGYHK